MRGTAKPPPKRYHYKLVVVPRSQDPAWVERALRDRLTGLGLSLFAIRHGKDGSDVMGDSGTHPLKASDLRRARAIAVDVRKSLGKRQS